MNIQQTQIEELRHLLTDEKNKDMEMEFRFGAFAKAGFEPSISYETFLRLDGFLKSFCILKGVVFSINTVSKNSRNTKYFHPVGVDFDLPKENNDWKFVNEENIVKEKINNIDINDYGIRFSLSKETKTEKTEHDGIVFIKYRKRIIYSWGEDIQFHLSKNLKNNEIYYDIEIELKPLNNKTFKNFMDFLGNTFLTCYQNTNKIMKERTRNTILKDFEILVNSKKFIGSKAESLYYHKLNFEEEYSVSQKFDGERKLLYFRKSRIIVINYNNFLWVLNKEPLSDNIIESYENSVFDCEHYNGKFYIFDVLYYKGQKVTENLKSRIEIYKKLVDDLCCETILAKEHYFNKSLYKNVLDTLNLKNEFLTDGVIITPVNKGVPLKYKDGEPNTVDFKIKKCGGGKWELYCYTKNNKEVVYQNTEYDIKGICYVDSATDSKYTDNMVVEFYYDKHQNNFIPIRERLDKIRGNFKSVVDDNLFLDLYPFRLQWLKNPNMTENDVYFYNIKRFINYTCRKVIKEFKNRGTAVVYSYSTDDIYKVIDNNIRNTYLIGEPSDNILNKISKISENKTTKSFVFNITKEIPDEKYSMVFSFDPTTNFTEQDVKTIKKNMTKGSVIIVFYYRNRQDIGDSTLFKVEKNLVDAKGKKTLYSENNLIQLFERNNISLLEEVTFKKYYDSWVHNNNFLNKQESRYLDMYSYLVFKN